MAKMKQARKTKPILVRENSGVIEVVSGFARVRALRELNKRLVESGKSSHRIKVDVR